MDQYIRLCMHRSVKNISEMNRSHYVSFRVTYHTNFTLPDTHGEVTKEQRGRGVHARKAECLGACYGGR